jgi:hypothetical protein
MCDDDVLDVLLVVFVFVLLCAVLAPKNGAETRIEFP